ncbi:glycoside hydrolase family 9 protein [Kribbella sp. NBC_01245]|uniref:glycoside hydrolase family 9 protein n=1 Tax=Kribbella sp. NBC_01245 TaxID=2903578 RepID=UPI002E2D2D3F|nr:glycoside hydrolase family 9 protein [Kribbella sp. NBC_01245]
MSTVRRLLLACLGTTLIVPLLAAPALADGPYERLLNTNFDSGTKSPWWSSANSPSTVTDGRLCAQIPAGTVNPWSSMIGQNDVPLEQGQPYTLRFDASATRPATIRATAQMAVAPHTTPLSKSFAITTTPQTFTVTATSTVTEVHSQVTFQMGGATEAYTLCLDNISFVGGVVPPGGPRDLGSPVRVNQHGYLVDGPKRATVVTALPGEQPWRLVDAAGAEVAAGQTSLYGPDAMSGDTVQLVSFDDFRVAGKGYRLAVGSEVSEPFEISEDLYDGLRRDSLAYFYHNRSGIPIESEYVGDAYDRPAGHLGVAPNTGDTSVPCLPGTCDYSLDVRGGWYDAGDHGKYVVNGALAAWQLLDLYERSATKGDFAGVADRTLRIPESGNRRPDVLDEARWEIDFMLRMQVPSGEPLAGMVHPKIHDVAWTGLPLPPAADAQPRYLYPPTTAATLNVAAVGARCARIYAVWDPALALRCLIAATKAWKAAKAHPELYAPAESVGGGPYADTDVRDEFSWAAAELFATTGLPTYRSQITTGLTTDGFSWRDMGGLADLALARVPWRLTGTTRKAVEGRIKSVADQYVAALGQQGYANPYLPTDGKYVWGSNSATANNAMVIAMAYDLTKQARYREAAVESMDYLLGRNALNQSYVTGYGERSAQNQHHRFWAHSLDAALPNPAPGSLAGGPNSGLQDPVAQRNLPGCAPATCYVDDIGSWSTNEVAVNWNSALAWISAFASSVSDAGAGGGSAAAGVLASPIDLTSGFYVDPNSTPATWVRNNGGDSRAAAINSSIATKPMARWFGNPPSGTTIGTIVGAFVGAADNADKAPILVAYNLPGRDACGGHSGGGAGSPSAYRTWVAAFASAIGTRPAIVILEPDALGDFECMTAAQITERNGMLSFALQQFRDKAPNTWAYLDGGNAGWVAADTMAQRLNGAGVTYGRGFAVNVSNYYTTSQSTSYGNSVRNSLSSRYGYTKPFVVDTSRNGNGSNGQWCNPAGRRLGSVAQLGGGAEMLLWVKVPGNSDGPCGTAPNTSAGQFSPTLAINLINGT